MSDNFIDTNIVIYALSNDGDKRLKALELLRKKPLLSVQVLNETANILIRKFVLQPLSVQTILKTLMDECVVIPITETTTLFALHIMQRYQYSFYDSLIIATALKAQCSVLYSEDMHHQQRIEEQLTIINPFK